MNIALAIGIFFLVLGAIYGFAARSAYVAAMRQWTPAGRARRRIAIIYATVGLALVIWQLALK